VLLLRALGFGRADLVVAAPKSWIDVETMSDLEDVAHDYLARSGRRMRVATKYLAQTRAFFARHGVVDYRIIESGGATEGAPASGAAELIVDITTTGATLAANGLKILADGLILSSQAQLAASLRQAWTSEQLAVAERLLRIVEARAAALASMTLIWPASGGPDEAVVVDSLVTAGALRRPHGLLVAAGEVASAAGALTAAGLGPVTASRPDFVFDLACEAFESLSGRIKN
jgi:ATP phosphoribosyltransferase